MMDNKTTITIGGISFTGLLTIVFIVLKLIGAIDWSWIWVLSPIWINTVLTILLAISFTFMEWWINR